jgi:hypothetical protein
LPELIDALVGIGAWNALLGHLSEEDGIGGAGELVWFDHGKSLHVVKSNPFLVAFWLALC